MRLCIGSEMSGSAQEGDSASVEAGPTPSQDLYREKPASTVVRVLTVLAYLLSVSLAAILLSVYYICIWKSPDLPLNESYEMLSARRGDHHDYHPALTLDSSPYNNIGKLIIISSKTYVLLIRDYLLIHYRLIIICIFNTYMIKFAKEATLSFLLDNANP